MKYLPSSTATSRLVVVWMVDGAHVQIRFTFERKITYRFSLLDVGFELYEDDSLKHTLYQKPTWAGNTITSTALYL